MLKLPRVCLLGLIALALLAGCEENKTAAVPTPPAIVTVAQPLSKLMTEYIEYTGYTSADKTVELRAQVRGYLQDTLFKPRDQVKAGQVLFQIDPRPYQADLDKAKADLAVAQAQLALTEAKLMRMEEALKAKSISEVQVIEQRADRDKAKADVDKCKALIETAQLNLDYTKITAPIDGLMSLDLPKKGDLIDPQQTLLSTITDDTTVYIKFSVSEADLLRIREMMRQSGESLATKRSPAVVYVGLDNETGFPHEAVLDYVAPGVDRETGTIECRARFDNKNHELMGGLHARLRIPISDPEQALLVAERAIGLDQGQRYLLVVNDKNIVEYRPVQAGVLEGGLRVIQSGLKAGEWVIVNGLQRVRPGVQVSPQRVAMTSGQAASRPATTASAPTQPAH